MINTIIHGDCLDVMKQYKDNHFDLVLTDPPYGVDLKYNTYNDSKENLIDLIKQFMPELFRISKNIIITAGNMNMFEYPKPDWTFAWVNSAGTGQSKYGFTCWHPVLFYGEYKQKKNILCRDIIMDFSISDKVDHPCPKPRELWLKLLNAFSEENDLIFDGFAGSGTTALACIELNRRFICVEKDKDYYEIAKKRIEDAKSQLTLF